MKNLANILSILSTIITTIVPIYFILHFWVNAEREERMLSVIGYSRKSINVYLILFNFSYYILPVFSVFFNRTLNFELWKSGMIFTYVLISILLISLYIEKYCSYKSVLLVIPLFLNPIILFIVSGNNTYEIIVSCLLLIVDIMLLKFIYHLIKNKIYKKEKTVITLTDSIMYFIVIPLCWSAILYQIYIIIFVNINKLFSELKYSVLVLYIVIGILILQNNYKKLQKTHKVEIIFSKNESNITNNKIGVILSETNDDIIIEFEDILYRYRKSDIFCIKEIRDIYSDSLNKTEN